MVIFLLIRQLKYRQTDSGTQELEDKGLTNSYKTSYSELMARRKLKKLHTTTLGLPLYWRLLFSSLLRLDLFPENVVFTLKMADAFFFIFINSLIIFIVINFWAAFKAGRLAILFLGIGQTILYLPLLLMGIFAIGVLFFLLARLLGGSGELINTLKAFLFTLTGLLLFAFPYLWILGCISFVWLFTRALSKVHHFGVVRAFCVLLIPALVVIFFKVVFFS
ncbi:hypothetical protein A3D25_00615 [Candidatus Daviesbacteria bacterium RIFCSPHIGHO2_02_FULL_43_12]|uniref:Yip1 domain-containing protein n=1 Tax=Candidatus Daviesbacteria bacterium RIFCSPHIGHO2_02_FULL_43_12 TaxID=1797776 RepID=A0A1F5KIE1_9BACT|nr:MAG: hypothetical protein A3D25_00615 [Candidatus Daviesbacteria bacterium RIFCSPHIGHO2_02_FULL_43_12]OGE70164.1 MAG: hypothetical protein A3B55_00385 [Candidatus Daviesbacteria bacterium RIFCSPLOWO2_01_FULL_43_15]